MSADDEIHAIKEKLRARLMETPGVDVAYAVVALSALAAEIGIKAGWDSGTTLRVMQLTMDAEMEVHKPNPGEESPSPRHWYDESPDATVTQWCPVHGEVGPDCGQGCAWIAAKGGSA